MRLDGLKDFHNSMKINDVKRSKFIFTYSNVAFDVFFFTDEVPYKLCIGVIARNFYFELNVIKGYIIDINIGDKYLKLIEILGLKYNKENPFKTIYFFNELNKKIPKKIDVKNKWKPSDYAVYKRNVEEANKIYFCGWFDDDKVSKNVRKENLEKTKEILGTEAYLMCKKNNISSKWTDIPSKAIEYYLPKSKNDIRRYIK